MYIEDIYFFEVNTKYISSSVLKTSEFHECAARVKISMFFFNSKDEIYLVLTEKKYIFFLLYTFFGD